MNSKLEMYKIDIYTCPVYYQNTYPGRTINMITFKANIDKIVKVIEYINFTNGLEGSITVWFE